MILMMIIIISQIYDIMLSSVYIEDNWPYGVLVRRFFRNNKNAVKK